MYLRLSTISSLEKGGIDSGAIVVLLPILAALKGMEMRYDELSDEAQTRALEEVEHMLFLANQHMYFGGEGEDELWDDTFSPQNLRLNARLNHEFDADGNITKTFE